MLVFPQLSTGASALYPLRKSCSTRTVVNTLDDGRRDTYSDPDNAITVWELQGRGLTRAEWDAIEELFTLTFGMWGTFTFLDPVSNLLVHSEDLPAPTWDKAAAIQLTTGIADPVGGAGATRVVNSGQSLGQVQQALSVPGNFHYCFSVWVRTTSGSTVTAAIIAGPARISQQLVPTTSWQRMSVSGNPAQSAITTVEFQLELAAGASIEVFAPQAEPQLAPSDYKATGARGGVYAKARFGSDRLTVRAQGGDVQDAIIRIVNTER